MRDIMAIILAGGWHGRAVMDVNGEPSIRRMVRMLRDEGVERIVISVAYDEESILKLFIPKDNIVFHHSYHHYSAIENGVVKFVDNKITKKNDLKRAHYVNSCFSLMNTKSLWGDNTIILMSDIVFSQETLREILDYDVEDIIFFGKDYSKPDGKILWELKWDHNFDIFSFKFNMKGKELLSNIDDPIQWASLKGGAPIYNYFVQCFKEKLWLHFVMRDRKYLEKFITPKALFIVEIDGPIALIQLNKYLTERE